MARTALAMMLSIVFSVVVSAPAFAKPAPRETPKKSVAAVKKQAAKPEVRQAKKPAAKASRSAADS